MANIFNLKINNFRGIKGLDHTFGKSKFICLVGRGDSGKTTILDAISYVLNSNWNLQLSDNDFYGADVTNPIEIEVTLTDVSDSLLQDTKYGLHVRGIGVDGETVVGDIEEGQEKALTVILKVEADLEPKWFVTSGRAHQEDIEIRSSDRASFNISLLSDYLDRHFSWGKGSPLSMLLKKEGSDSAGSLLLDEIRALKASADIKGFEHLDSVIDIVKKSTQKFGVNIEDIKTSIDIKDLAIKDNRVILHNESVPLKLSGKGSKRIMSTAIQAELSQGGVLLIDEIEQGLEPDRVKHLVRTLSCRADEQVLVTTHSQHVVEELEPENIFIVNNEDGKAEIKQFSISDSEKFKSLFRSCPEALYANKIIVCEGKTEIGFCRALDKKRVDSSKKSMSSMGAVYTLGGGDGFNKKAQKLKTNAGKQVCVFCDSDKDSEINSPTKVELGAMDVKVFDCEDGNCIEKQISVDLPWKGIVELCEYILTSKNINKDIKTYIKESTDLDWSDADTTENREIFYKASTFKKITNQGGVTKTADKSWFKRIDHGEKVGEVCLKYSEELDAESGLLKLLSGLDSWIDS